MSLLLMLMLMLALLAPSARVASAHGAMNDPMPRSAKGSPFSAADPAWCFETAPGACLWFNVGCVPGCPACEGEKKVLYLDPARDVPSCNASDIREPTLPEYACSWNVGNVSSKGDWTRYSPWYVDHASCLLCVIAGAT